MAYTDIDDPTIYFNTVLYTGTGSSQGITGVGFQPDFLWVKSRSNADYHYFQDVVRGVTKQLATNTTAAETSYTNGVTAFGTDGFTVDSSNWSNRNGGTFVSWNWKAGTAFTNDQSATGIGTLDSTGSSNQTAGFSIVSYTSNGSASQSVAHNLGGVPEMIISKNRDSTSASYNYWTVYHHSLATANDKKLKLNTNDAVSTTNEWGDTNPTSTVYSLHTSGDGTTNVSTDKIISYCFRSIKGYSKIGSYTGNGNADGTFVYTGFKPAFVLTKRTDAAAQWQILDNKRDTYNPAITALFPDSSDADTTSYNTDFLSNGFKFRSTTTARNGSGNSYIYMAFASNPLVTSSGVPATAR